MQQPVPESVEKAQNEADQLKAWLDQYEQMSKMHADIEKRQAFLDGFLAQPGPNPSSNGHVAEFVDTSTDQ